MNNNEQEETVNENPSTDENPNRPIQEYPGIYRFIDVIRKLVTVQRDISENQASGSQNGHSITVTDELLSSNSNEEPSTTSLHPQNEPPIQNPEEQRDTEEFPVNITPLPFSPQVYLGPPPLVGAPPSYSAIMRVGADLPPAYRRFPIRIQPSPPFIAPPPPPPYSQAEGYQVDRSLIVTSVDDMVWGPDPVAIVCPRCTHVIVTATESHRSNLTHFSAVALCLCGCWPCCLLPYCMNSCKNTLHYCPSCQHFLGMYRPW